MDNKLNSMVANVKRKVYQFYVAAWLIIGVTVALTINLFTTQLIITKLANADKPLKLACAYNESKSTAIQETLRY
jgi:hypothetical protein